MRLIFYLRMAAAVCAIPAVLGAQAAPPRIIQPTPEQPPATLNPATPQQPAAPGAQPAAGQPATTPPRLASNQPFQVSGVSLTEMIETLARAMKINYILDP